MASTYLEENLRLLDSKINVHLKGQITHPPKYNPHQHYLDVAQDIYYYALLTLRHAIKMTTDSYFCHEEEALCIDLFMYTPSVSSPMASGSDSEPIPFKFGDLDTFLVDSSQFGFEPILQNTIEKVYCYLPSMRGEDPDDSHLNQFYHCETEIVGELKELITIAEEYITYLLNSLSKMQSVINSLSRNASRTYDAIERSLSIRKYPEITFDEAINILDRNNISGYANFYPNGRDLTQTGERNLTKILGYKTPYWITKYDRDRVPFYHKPDPDNSNKVLCADLICPSILDDSFGGELLGAGQRQDNSIEMYESLKRQSVDSEPYEWYIELRKRENYRITSGFGMGIERFISWLFGQSSIRNTIIYPRIKNVLTYP